jgi:hypothetical protein
MMAMFKVGSEEDEANDSAMMAYGGAAALDLANDADGTLADA